MNFQINEAKKTEFKSYLDKSGVLELLTRVLLGLYEIPDRPVNALEYYSFRFIVRNLGAPSDSKTEMLKNENEDLKIRNAQLKLEVEQLKEQIEDIHKRKK